MSLDVAFVHIAYTGVKMHNQEFWSHFEDFSTQNRSYGVELERRQNAGTKCAISQNFTMCVSRASERSMWRRDMLDPMLSAVMRLCLAPEEFQSIDA